MLQIRTTLRRLECKKKGLIEHGNAISGLRVFQGAFAILLLIFLVFSTANARPMVKVLEAPTVKGPDFTLGEIATITGGSAEEREQLWKLPMGAAAVPGQGVTITQKTLHMRIVAVDALGLADWELPEQIRVTTGSQTIEGTWLSGKAKEFIQMQLHALPGEKVLSVLSEPANITVPLGEIEGRTYLSSSFRVGYPIVVRVQILVDGKRYRTVPVTVISRLYLPVVVAKLPIAAKEVITPSMLTMERLDVGKVNDYLTGLEQAQGLETRRLIPAGAIIASAMLVKPKIVQQGQEIVIIAKLPNGGTVSANGKALQRGSLGERIRIQNTASRRNLSGVIVSEDTVEVTALH